jgi:hypothetical protein
MRRKILTILPLVGALTFAQHAQANTVSFWFTGPGVSAHGTLTYSPTPGGADPITGITGVFSDSNTGLNGKPDIVNATITGLYAINPVVPLPVNVTAPDFSLYPIVNGVPSPPASQASPGLSYDNTFYPDGSPIVCTDYPASGGLLDVYGVMFTISNGDVVDLWSNGVFPGAPASSLTYGVAVADANYTYDYVGGVAFAAPEPSTWAMIILGFAGLGFARHHKAKSRTPALSAA